MNKSLIFWSMDTSNPEGLLEINSRNDDCAARGRGWGLKEGEQVSLRTVEPGTKNRCGLRLRKITIGDGGSSLAILNSQ